MKIETKFTPGEIVSHVTDETARGVICSVMVRGANHSYEVQWGIKDLCWHLEYELTKCADSPAKAGFHWRSS